MLEHCRRTAGAMVEVLSRQGDERFARKIGYAQIGTEPYLFAGLDQADIKFSVFIVCKTFVVAPDRQECTPVKCGVVPMVDIA